MQLEEPDEDRANCNIKDSIPMFFLNPSRSYDFKVRSREMQTALVFFEVNNDPSYLEKPAKPNFVKKIRAGIF